MTLHVDLLCSFLAVYQISPHVVNLRIDLTRLDCGIGDFYVGEIDRSIEWLQHALELFEEENQKIRKCEKFSILILTTDLKSG